MAVVIEATVGDANANSYVSEAEAIAYAATRLNLAGWATVTGTEATDNERKALIEATREIDSFGFKGFRVTETQALAWPREGVIAYDAPRLVEIGTYTGYPEYAIDEIPGLLKTATIELAFAMLAAGSTDLTVADPNAGVIREKIDVLETEWEPGTRKNGLARYPRIVRLLAPFLADTRSFDVIRV